MDTTPGSSASCSLTSTGRWADSAESPVCSPNPDLSVAMYVKHEAVLSSQIEGSQSTLEDVLEFEAGKRSEVDLEDVEEVVNYARAMKHGMARLEKDYPAPPRSSHQLHLLTFSILPRT